MSKIISISLLTLLFLSGCSFSKNQPNYFSSTINLKTKIDTTIIADDMFKFVSTYYAPNKTILYLDTNDFNKNFHNYIVQKFKEAGYAVTSDNKLHNLTFFSYKITHDNTLFLVTYNINESKISRVYTIENDTLIPIGGITRFNFTREPLFFKMPSLIKESVQVKNIKQTNDEELLHVNTFTEEVIHPKVIKTEKPKEEKTLKTPPKKEVKAQKTLKASKQTKRITPQAQAPEKSTKVPLAIDENWEPVASKRDNNATENSKVLAMVEELNKNSLPAPQEPQKETKTPLAMVEEVKPIETPKIEAPTLDKNASTEEKIAALVEQLTNEPNAIKDDNKTIKNDTKLNANTTEVKNDINATQTIISDTKPKIETVTVQELPFELNSTTVIKELTLVETIEEALRVYPDFDKEKLRADLLRLVVKNPEIDRESVKTMPFTKGLLLELLKVAKGTRN